MNYEHINELKAKREKILKSKVSNNEDDSFSSLPKSAQSLFKSNCLV